MGYHKKLNDNLSNLAEILAEYDTFLNSAETALRIEGKMLETANREQPLDYYEFAKKMQQLRYIQNLIQGRQSIAESNAYKKLTEENDRKLSTSDKQYYMANDPAVVAYTKLKLMVEEVLGQYEIVVKAFEARGYALKNITEARIHSLHYSLLD